MQCRHVAAGAQPYARGLCRACHRHRGSLAEALAETCPGCPECAGWRMILPIAPGTLPIPPVYPCADCGRPVAHDGGRCVRCAGLAERAAHPVPEAWAPGRAA